MLGKYVKIKVTVPVFSTPPEGSFEYLLNFGSIENRLNALSPVSGAFIMGINHPVKNFDGKTIACVRFSDNGEVVLIAAPKSKRFIDYDIRESIAFYTRERPYVLECLYERSCGAVVYRVINGEYRCLLIKNKRSAHWGFPKGHMERGETPEDTARREVLEETGVSIDIVPGFVSRSEYTIQNKVEKSVSVFAATTPDTQTVIQREEIEDYIWLKYEDALEMLKFENDKNILEKSHNFLVSENII